MADVQRQLEFRRCLNRIANRISRQNFDDLKFMCKDAVPVARMERVRSTIDLFQALEERGKLAHNNLDYFAQVLTSVGCARLLDDLINKKFMPPPAQLDSQKALSQRAMHTGRDSTPTNQEFCFTECLMQIAQGLQSREIETLSFTWADALLGMSMDKVFSATQLFQLLQQRQIISPTDMRQLYDELHDIGRSDLAMKINEYLKRTNQYPYDVPEEEIGGIRPHPGAPYNYQIRPIAAQDDLHVQRRQQMGMMNGAPQSSVSNYRYPIPAQDDVQEYQQTPPYDSSLGSSMSSHSMCTESSSESSYLPRPQLHSQASDFSSVSVDPSSRWNYTYAAGNDMRSPPPPYQLKTRLHTQDLTRSRASPNPPMSIEEATPYQYSTSSNSPYGLTFCDDDEKKRSPAESQGLTAALAEKESLLLAREREMHQLQKNLEEARSHNEIILSERVGEAEVYMTSIKELEELLGRKNMEVEEVRLELERHHEEIQALNASRGHVNPDELYHMDKNPHGICLIINNHKFYHPTDPDKAHPDRGGAEIDQFNLAQTFRYLRYRVEVRENLTSDQMTDIVMQMSRRDHSQYDSFICCILTHGEKELVHGSDSNAVNLADLTGLMKFCKSLYGKPKMFFVQACRGDIEDKGVTLPEWKKDSGGVQSVIPQEADFLYGYATPPGSAAYRSRRHGSWYISELCKVFTDNAYHSNLSSMMKKVNNNVSKAFTKEGLKQCAEYVDRLRQEVHFFHFIKNKPKH